jgi:hypothetical protein
MKMKVNGREFELKSFDDSDNILWVSDPNVFDGKIFLGVVNPDELKDAIAKYNERKIEVIDLKCPFCGKKYRIPVDGDYGINCTCGAYARVMEIDDAYMFYLNVARKFGVFDPLTFVDGIGYVINKDKFHNKYVDVVDAGLIGKDSWGDECVIQWVRKKNEPPWRY